MLQALEIYGLKNSPRCASQFECLIKAPSFVLQEQKGRNPDRSHRTGA